MDVRSITLNFTCKVKKMSTGNYQNLSDYQNFKINGIDGTNDIADLHLIPQKNGWV